MTAAESSSSACRCSVASCSKCGKPISFVQKSYRGFMKWCPVNLDGSEHWDACRGIVRTPEWRDRRMAEEAAEFPCRGFKGAVTHIYCGSVPPWDESFGAFRFFTEAEITEGAICRPHAKR